MSQHHQAASDLKIFPGRVGVHSIDREGLVSRYYIWKRINDVAVEEEVYLRGSASGASSQCCAPVAHHPIINHPCGVVLVSWFEQVVIMIA